MKIVTVIGARPQFVKAAVVSREISKTDGINEIIIHTGQHFDKNMSKIFFDELDILKPHYNLGIGGGNHGAMTGRQLEAIEKVLFHEKPDMVVVYGDTNSTIAGTLAAVKLRIPVAHVEAGLRSFNRSMPEEINRVLTDHAADVLFAPTEAAVRNLVSEGITGNSVKMVGDVMYDAAIFYADRAKNKSNILDKLKFKSKKYILATFHRQENTDDQKRLRHILKGFASLTLPVILPLHPRTRTKIDGFGMKLPPTLYPISPIGYLDMVMLEKNAAMIMTDSGGVQKEAYFHKVPCITLRDETEWTELVEHGFNRLLDVSLSDWQPIAKEVLAYAIDWDIRLYGNGHAAQLIASVLEGRV